MRLERSLGARLWGAALEHLLLPAGDRVFGQRMMARWRFLRQAQWWPRGQIAEYRDKRLRELVAVAFQECEFYRALWRSDGVDFSRVTRASDLHLLPIVTKELLQRADPVSLRRRGVVRFYWASSSGSTGQPVQVAEDRATAGEYRAAFLLALEWAGWRLGDAFLQTGMNLRRDLQRALKDRLLRTSYVSAYDLREQSLARMLNRLRQRNAQFVMGYPGSLEALAVYAAQAGWNRSLRAAVTWGDLLLPAARQRIERSFSTRVFDTYGLGEGIQVAAQCGVGGAYHVHDTETIVEIVDREGKPVPDGTAGRIVLTRLFPGPTPLIRYDSGDLGTLRSDQVCPCGRNLSILGSLIGRQGDVIVTPSGNRLIVHFFTGILEYYREIRAFQIRQISPTQARLLVVPGEGWTAEVGAEAIQRLQQRGADLDFVLEVVPTIPLTRGGKHRFVIAYDDGGNED